MAARPASADHHDHRASRFLSPWVRITGVGLCLWASCSALLLAASESLQLRATTNSEIVHPGDEGTLLIELLDQAGRPATAKRPLQLQLKGGGPLFAESRPVLAAGTSKLELPFRAMRAGAWSIDVQGRGVFPANIMLLCSEDATQRSATEETGDDDTSGNGSSRGGPPESEASGGDAPDRDVPGRDAPDRELTVGESSAGNVVPDRETGAGSTPERERISADGVVLQERIANNPRVLASGQRPTVSRNRPGTEARTRPARPAGGGLVVAAPTRPRPEGEVRLIPAEPSAFPGPDGNFSVKLRAVWHENGQPKRRSSDLDLNLFLEPQGAGRELRPDILRLTAGDFQAQTEVLSRSAGEVTLQALSPEGQVAPVRLRFLPSLPQGLDFTQQSYEGRGLVQHEQEVVVRLLGESGQPTVADRAREVTLSLKDGGSWTATIAPGDEEALLKIQLTRFGEHELRASSPGLTESSANLVYRLAWSLLALALLGGVLGALTRLLLRGGTHRWRSEILRSIALGAVAALLMLLLALFGLLSRLGGLLPAVWEQLASLPLAAPLACLLVGLLSGLAMEEVLGRFAGGEDDDESEEGGESSGDGGGVEQGVSGVPAG